MIERKIVRMDVQHMPDHHRCEECADEKENVYEADVAIDIHPHIGGPVSLHLVGCIGHVVAALHDAIYPNGCADDPARSCESCAERVHHWSRCVECGTMIAPPFDWCSTCDGRRVR